MSCPLHHIFLTPGFFGFANLGELLYFSHVAGYLPRACRSVGIEARVHSVHTYPTSSLRRRAKRLLAAMELEAAADDAPVHVVGHSSGGLDARLLLSPGTTLGRHPDALEALLRRVESVVTICSPNHGTPVASFFTSILGKQLLRVLSLATMYALRFGRLPASALVRLGAVVARADDMVGWRNNVLDQLYSQLLNDFSPARRREIESFMGDVGTDQALLPQLTAEGVDVLNASTADRPGVRYGSVVSYARRPGLVSTASVGLDPYGQATHALFAGLYRLASAMHAEHLPQLSDPQGDALLGAFRIIPAASANDGVVPTLSQVWGQIVHATRADHLDVLGHFGQPDLDPPHIDWLSSGSGFERPQFEALWDDVARFLAGRPPDPPRGPAAGGHLPHLFSR